MAGLVGTKICEVFGNVSLGGNDLKPGAITLYKDLFGVYFIEVSKTTGAAQSGQLLFLDESSITVTNESLVFSGVFNLSTNAYETVHLKGAQPSQIQQFLDALPASIKVHRSLLMGSEEQLQQEELREAGLLKKLIETENQKQKENKERRLRETEQQLRGKDEQKQNLQTQKDGQQENLQRQLREMEQQLRGKDEQQQNLQRQLRGKDEQQQNLHRQLRKMEKQLREKEQQLTSLRNDNEKECAHLQQKLSAKLEELSELQRELRDKVQDIVDLQKALTAAEEKVSKYESQLRTRDWVLSRDEIQITKKILGDGSYARVFEGRYCGSPVAVKKLHRTSLSPQERSLFEREMDIASRCRHPCLLQFIGATQDESPLFVTELMETSLRALLGKHQLSETEVSVISLDVARALNYLHQRKPTPIVHRDVSSANVLLWKQNNQWRGKVSDYGTAKFLEKIMTSAVGALIYRAPEADGRDNQTDKMDVYSFGVLVCEMFIRDLPDFDRRDEQVARVANTEFRDLIKWCIKKDLETRPSMEGVIEELEQFNSMS